jgi:hypothetical protein
MKVPRYDIFSGLDTSDPYAKWLEAVEGLGAAAHRMKQIARDKPGYYFVSNTQTHKVLASINTHGLEHSEKASA